MSGRTRMQSAGFRFGVRASASAAEAEDLKERLAFSERCLATLRADSRAAAERIAGLCRQLDTRSSELALARQERDEARRERDAAVASLALAMADLREARAKADALGVEHAELQRRQADLVRENSALKHRLNVREGTESPFGKAGGPSTDRPFKSNSPQENQERRGGAKPGHEGHGRHPFREGDGATARHEDCLDVSGRPPCCGEMRLAKIGERRREYDRYIPARTEHVVAIIGVFRCDSCGRVIYARPGDVLRRMSHSNSFLAAGAVKFYVQGHTSGDVARELGVGVGTFFSMMDTVADRLLPAFEETRLEAARQSNVHMDETTWWTDGVKGYAWVIWNANVSLHLFPGTRSSSVPAEFFGYADGRRPAGVVASPGTDEDGEDAVHGEGREVTAGSRPLPGDGAAAPPRRTPLEEYRDHEGKTIVNSDRYGGYSPLDVRHQYCFEHLKRDLKKLLDYSPGNDEVRRFHDALRPLLAESMRLCADTAIPDGEYYRKAQGHRARIREIVFAEARDSGVQGYQNIWREKWDSLFEWVGDRRVKCDNNAAERAVRPTVIARKISMGSQGAGGVRNREIITSVLMTVKVRGEDPYRWLVGLLDAMAREPATDAAGALPRPDVTLRRRRRGSDTAPAPA